jgi:membrane protease subunit HflK
VDLQTVKPPEAVKDAFDDAIKAREDEQRQINQAEAYRNEIIPRARGAAARLTEEAMGYKERVIARAEGQADRFELLLDEYQQAPEVTRQRLYLDTMQYVLDRNSKILMDTDEGSNLTYLPIDKLMQQSRKQNKKSSGDDGAMAPTQSLPAMPPSRNREGSSSQYNDRSREVR